MFNNIKDAKDEEGAEYVTFEKLLTDSDFVLITMAYTPESKVNEKKLSSFDEDVIRKP